MTKQITEIGWRVKTDDGKEYGSGVIVEDYPNLGLTKKKQITEIKELVTETMQLLAEQAIDTMSMVLTGKTETGLMVEEATKELP